MNTEQRKDKSPITTATKCNNTASTSSMKSYKVMKKCRYEKFKTYFNELESLLPCSKDTKSTQKSILLDSVAYIKALEFELGLINESHVDWAEHYKQLWELFENEAPTDIGTPVKEGF